MESIRLNLNQMLPLFFNMTLLGSYCILGVVLAHGSSTKFDNTIARPAPTTSWANRAPVRDIINNLYNLDIYEKLNCDKISH